MANQTGHVFRKGGAWFLRYRDSFVENGQLVRKQVCKKLSAVDPEHARLKRAPESVLQLAEEELHPVNSCGLDPGKNLIIQDFVTRVYFPNMVGALRASTLRG